MSPDAIVLIIVDAADNATTAAAKAIPPDPSFVHELATANLESLPPNVRFVVSARTARKDSLGLPPITAEVPCLPFTENEFRLHLLETFPNASNADITSFHALTGGNPRVQSYALQAANGKLETLFEAMLPNGKSLPDVIEASFTLALLKLGERDILDGLVASLAYLPTPATLAAVAATAGTTAEIVRDFVLDLGRGLRLEADTVTISDEDFEDHIKARAASKRTATLGKIADYFWTHYKSDVYSAAYVADYLIEAGRQQHAFDVIDTDTKVQAVQDPIRKREIQIRRLTLALASCRQTGNTVKALQTILLAPRLNTTRGHLTRLSIAKRNWQPNSADRPLCAAAFSTGTRSELMVPSWPTLPSAPVEAAIARQRCTTCACMTRGSVVAPKPMTHREGDGLTNGRWTTMT